MNYLTNYLINRQTNKQIEHYVQLLVNWSNLSDNGDEVNLFSFIVNRFGQSDDSLVRQLDLERRLVLDEKLHLAVEFEND